MYTSIYMYIQYISKNKYSHPTPPHFDPIRTPPHG